MRGTKYRDLMMWEVLDTLITIVLKTKRDSKGNIKCCTTHPVVEEFTSKVGVDHSATFLLVF